MQKFLGVMMFLAASVGSSLYAVDINNRDEVIRAVRGYYESLQTISGNDEIRIQLIKNGERETPYLEKKSAFAFKDLRKLRRDLWGYKQDGTVRGHGLHVYDGQYHKSLNYRAAPQDKGKNLFGVVEGVDDTVELSAEWHFFSMLGLYFGRYDSVVDTLERIDDMDISTVDLNGRQTVKIEIVMPIGKGRGKQVYCFDPDRNFVLVRAEYWTPRGLQKVMQNEEFEEFEEYGIWVPVKGTFSVTLRESNGAISDEYDALISCSDLKINEPMDDSLFDIDFPIGTEVWNDMLGKVTIVGGVNLAKELRKVSAEMDNVSFFNEEAISPPDATRATEVGDGTPADSPPPRRSHGPYYIDYSSHHLEAAVTLIILIAFTLVLISAICIVFALRRKRKRNRSAQNEVLDQ